MWYEEGFGDCENCFLAALVLCPVQVGDEQCTTFPAGCHLVRHRRFEELQATTKMKMSSMFKLMLVQVL